MIPKGDGAALEEPGCGCACTRRPLTSRNQLHSPLSNAHHCPPSPVMRATSLAAIITILAAATIGSLLFQRQTASSHQQLRGMGSTQSRARHTAAGECDAPLPCQTKRKSLAELFMSAAGKHDGRRSRERRRHAFVAFLQAHPAFDAKESTRHLQNRVALLCAWRLRRSWANLRCST